jgi:nickel/cobalt exporter
MIFRFAYATLILVSLVFSSGIQTLAHPLPFGVSHDTFLKQEENQLILDYSLKMFYQDIEGFRIQIDTNNDKVITPQEVDNWGKILSQKIYITLGDDRKNIEKTIFNSDFNNLEDTLYVTVQFDLFFDNPKLIENVTSLKIHNSYRIQSGDIQDWNFAYDTNSMNVENVSFADSENLEANIISFIPNQNESNNSQNFQNQNLITNPTVFGDFSGRITTLLRDQDYSLATISTLLVIAFIFGMAHTLTPGHGKAIISTYMAAIRGNLFDAFIMSISTVISHTGTVIILAFIFFFLRESLSFVIPFVNINIQLPALNIRQFIPYLSIISGTSIIIIGLWLFKKRLNEFINNKVRQAVKATDLNTHEHNHHHHNHTEHNHNHDEKTVMPHSHGDHHHTHHIPTKKLNLKESIILGLSTGLNPCIDAVAILILSISLEQNILGIVIILVFSLGMGLTLTAIGYGIGKGINFGSNKIVNGQKILEYLPMISSLLIALIGLFLII